MRVLVTGGAGFIGSAVCRHLCRVGDEVLNVDKMTYAATLGSTAELAISGRFQFARLDIGDRAALARAFEEFRPETVIHLAAETHVDRSITGPTPFIETNIVGTYTLLDAALAYWRRLKPVERERFRFLHVSTDEVYGSLGDEGLFTEDTPYAPTSPYSASKASSDHLATAWFHTYELPVVISNCSNNYGPYHLPEKLIPLMIIRAMERKKLPVYGDGKNVRDWLYVEDHARALELIAKRGRPGEKYNVGGRNERSNIEVVTTICDLLDELKTDGGRPRRELIEFVADRPGHDRRYGIDASKLETHLGWRAEESFETGLRKTVKWYLERPDWWAPLLSHAEDRKGLPQVSNSGSVAAP